MTDLRPISDAPRDGTLIEVSAYVDGELEAGPYAMAWNPVGESPLSAAVGVWEAPLRAFTWTEGGDVYGPTHWRHLQ